MYLNFIKFIQDDIWLLDARHYVAPKSLGIRYLKILLLSIQGFARDLCVLHSSALTLYTLLSIVPVFAMLFGIAKGFGVETMLKERILEQVPQQDTMIIQVLEFAENMLAGTKGGLVAGIGIVVLFWTVIKVIGNIEESFNAIWKIKRGRGLSRKLSDYLSLMLLAPVLLIVSGSITVFLKTKITWLMTLIPLPDFGTWLVLKALSLSPLVIMSALFTFLFIFMPNCKVGVKPGLIAGILTGIVYQALQSIYLSLQLGVSSYNAIYGSFAALPLFLISLQISWMVVLLGCELSFYLQNYNRYKNNRKFQELSFTLQKKVALKIMHLIVHRFIRQQQPLSADEIAELLLLPTATVETIIKRLYETHLVSEVQVNDLEAIAYQPAIDSTRLTVGAVIQALEHYGQNTLPARKEDENNFELIDKQLDQAKSDTLLSEIQ